MLQAFFCVPAIDHFGFRMVRILCYGIDNLQQIALEVKMSKMVDQPEDYFRRIIPFRVELMIELDIEKQDYVKLLPDCRKLLINGGFLVAGKVGFIDADEFNHTISGHED